jgi:hypothetical protein
MASNSIRAKKLAIYYSLNQEELEKEAQEIT